MAKRIAHFASYLVGNKEVFGTAILIPGGYAFRPDDSRAVRLVSYKDVNLMLFGRCDLATAQYLDDEIRGGAAAICTSRQMEVQ